jgi:5-hydroxyisourate hydrolase
MGISTHILDVARGKPAAGVAVVLERQRGDGGWARVGDGVTNDDGRVKSLLPDGVALEAGVHRLSFAVEAYIAKAHGKGFYPEVTIAFRVENPAEHFHVPLLLSPYGYSTYRGS